MRSRAAALSALMLLASVPAAAQIAQRQRPGIVRIIVSDPTNLPILGADVVLTAPDAVTVHATTDDRGEARFDALRPGTYSWHVTSAGFMTLDPEPFTIRAGGHITREVTLQLAGFVEEVEVAPTPDDRLLMDSFSRQFTADQLEALPEDPEELAQVLRHLVGDDADIRVDGFKGGRLPPGTQIQDVRILYDIGAASGGGGPRVEITTTRGGGRWRNNAGVTVRDASLNARNSFSGLQPTGQTRQYSWNLNGPIVRNRTGLSLSVDGSRSMESQTIRAATPGGLTTRLLEQPSDGIVVWTRLDHQMTAAQSLRVDFRRNANGSENQGIGELDLPERAFMRKGSNSALHVGHHAILGGGYENDFRVSFEWGSNQVTPLSEARTLRVLDAFTSGGAQQRGNRRTRTLEVEHELEFTLRRQHHFTVGARIDGSDYRGDEYSNSSGTYTFSSLAAFEAGQPTTFTQRLGDPNFAYSLYRFGWYVQDDYRVRRNLIVNLGVRHDFQTHMRDTVNLAPRAGVSWTPSVAVRTTLRASAGLSYSELEAGMYEQLLLVDGLAQRDLVISDPGYPDPFSAGVIVASTPPSIIRASPNLIMPSSRRYSLGVDQPIGKLLRVRTTFSHQTGHNLFRSRNANAPVDGVRPDLSVWNVTQLESTARSLNESLQTEVSISYPPRRLSALVAYTFGNALNETDGPFLLPPDSVDVTGEWGPSRGDVRHRVNVGVNSDLVGGFRVATNYRAQSGVPYDITTGTDLNGDGIYNDRPAGVTRNRGRGTGDHYLDVTLTWRLSLGQQRPADGRGPSPRTASRDADLFRLEVFARATNVLNLINPQHFSGVLTSPFFGLPTSASPARRVAVGTRVWF